MSTVKKRISSLSKGIKRLSLSSTASSIESDKRKSSKSQNPLFEKDRIVSDFEVESDAEESSLEEWVNQLYLKCCCGTSLPLRFHGVNLVNERSVCSLCAQDSSEVPVMFCEMCGFIVCLSSCYQSFYLFSDALKNKSIENIEHWEVALRMQHGLERDSSEDLYVLALIYGIYFDKELFRNLWQQLTSHNESGIPMSHLGQAIDIKFIMNQVLTRCCAFFPIESQNIAKLHQETTELLCSDPRVTPESLAYAFQLSCKVGNRSVVNKGLGLKNMNPSENQNLAIRWASSGGQTAVVQYLLKDKRVNPASMENEALRMACRNGHAEVVQLLLLDKRTDPTSFYDQALALAAMNNHSNIVKVLLEDSRVDPSSSECCALRLAAEYGHCTIVRQLLHHQKTNPSASNNESIRTACANGHQEVVELLLQDDRVDASCCNGYPLIAASANGHKKIVDLLLKQKDVDPSVGESSALRLASWRAEKGVIKRLLKDNRVDASAKNDEPMKWALKHNNRKIVKYLLKDRRVAKKQADLIMV